MEAKAMNADNIHSNVMLTTLIPDFDGTIVESLPLKTVALKKDLLRYILGSPRRDHRLPP